MSGFGNTFRQSLNQSVFRGAALPTLTNIYVSLHTGDPGADGQTANEVSGGSYARYNSTANSTYWAAATAADPSTIANAQAFTFTTATGNWGTITHFGLWNHATNTAAANYIGGAALTASQVVNSGNTASFATGAIVHSFDSV
jgi:hypothetical protein